jgi:hypothetical protein
MHLWVTRQVLAYGVSHPRELALDDALLGLTTRREQNRSISRREMLLCVGDRVRSEPQPSRQGSASRMDGLVGGTPRKVQRSHEEDQQDYC